MSYYVTTPIYYVNAEPHLGHAYSTIAADVLARHQRQRGEDVFFLTGTDEHGEPVALAAEREGVTPQRARRPQRAAVPRAGRADRRVERLLHPHHRPRAHGEGPGGRPARLRQRPRLRGPLRGLVLPALRRLQDRGRARARTTPARSTRSRSLWESQQNWFFRLSAFQEPLERLYAERPDFVEPDFRRNEALSFIRGGLQDVSLSRPKLSWGVPVPWDPEQVIYVWWDALLNYYTALSYAREGEDLTERFWPANLHVIAKDILKFHTVYWPAFLLAAGIEPPRARLRPRLPADGREEDVEVARQRARPERGDRALRRRRAALLLHARGLLRPGRQRLGRRASSRATRPSSPTTGATSPRGRWR